MTLPTSAAVLATGGYDGWAHRAQVFERARFAERDKVRLLRSFDDAAPPDADVADPYYGDDRDFAEVLDQVERACRGLLDELVAVLPGDRV